GSARGTSPAARRPCPRTHPGRAAIPRTGVRSRPRGCARRRRRLQAPGGCSRLGTWLAPRAWPVVSFGIEVCRILARPGLDLRLMRARLMRAAHSTNGELAHPAAARSLAGTACGRGFPWEGNMTTRRTSRRLLATAVFIALAAPGMAFAQGAKERALEARIAPLEAQVPALMQCPQ